MKKKSAKNTSSEPIGEPDELTQELPEEPERELPIPAPQETVPPLMVQRMGKRFRIAYKENRNLARFNSGEAVDGGGFDDQITAEIHLAKITSGKTTTDPEEERVE